MEDEPTLLLEEHGSGMFLARESSSSQLFGNSNRGEGGFGVRCGVCTVASSSPSPRSAREKLHSSFMV